MTCAPPSGPPQPPRWRSSHRAFVGDLGKEPATRFSPAAGGVVLGQIARRRPQGAPEQAQGVVRGRSRRLVYKSAVAPRNRSLAFLVNRQVADTSSGGLEFLWQVEVPGTVRRPGNGPADLTA